ncbi:tubulin-like doman-containing protein [Tuwongella immobilis]|uniref:Protein kinase domain-containing protein n=1 Tax=Tuwongella immobilis TaxID=692036 RepID=A0A6C2YMC9_9BACT|nr:tubulin-like doman-containing protein [Tuwongella immobilis]VIP02750.1 serine threonine protein kinase : Serine/threonine protein kinase OS=Pirellula staleyi (strain ATCC 27377 / DSM 6068 / ICPB 4128) GN=Psta_0486 PE=4 SV=1: Pkinase: Tubulin_2 [Tuwongella immobilis]VTS02339.1 serine threonine protein kinase : Serine/threonine protein kinase OS=Pirellula staleyi (strain ATCC 27377 / DSM 6068 / ICPB 4128) GN=Psta_0486 PE=4 SV=1: Pkinase: Tubulin_2 [Tuwongella immobilis]
MAVRIATDEEPIPGYRLIERLGRGGFGEVWKAEAPGGLMKAIKFVYGTLDSVGEDSRPAEQELKALNRVKTIRHPYILSLERFDILEGQLVIVMELADRNLWDRFRECRAANLPGIPREELLRYMEESAEALDLMNNQYQLQHLDIKPQNLFLIYNHIKVADFGLAKDFDGVRAAVTGGVTPVYAAPETFEGWISRFSDQYSLAIVYQELLTGQRPFNGNSTRQLLMQHISGAPDLTSLPPDDQPIIGRALSKRPDDRYPSCAEMVNALRSAGRSSEIRAVPVPTPTSTPSNSTSDTKQPSIVSTPGPIDPLAKSQSVRTLPSLRTPGAPKLPSLTTQSQLLSSQSPLATQAGNGPLTQLRPSVNQTQRVSHLGIAPPERLGYGVLMPALIVGIGGAGMQVLQQLRRMLEEQFGPQTPLNHLQWLQIDTDLESLNEAASATGSAAFLGKELVHARLNRPAHYLTREGLPPLDSWLPNSVLYRMPRNPATLGNRAFGRLALMDNYRTIIPRIRQALEAFLHEDGLNESDRLTGLGVRTNHPRVYIATSLAGGTGSGMFVDLAYLIRNELRGMGFMRPDLVGILLMPGVDRNQTKNQALANTFAALSELYHFSHPGNTYETRFDLRENAILDAEAPLGRSVLLATTKASDPRAIRQQITHAASLMFQDLFTPMGRVTDETRSAYWMANPVDGMRCQTFGVSRLVWPRARLLESATRKFTNRLMQRWISKDSSSCAAAVRRWVSDEWNRRQLDFEPLFIRLQQTPDDSGRVPDDQVTEIVQPLEKIQNAPVLDAMSVCVALDEIFRIVGRYDSGPNGIEGSIRNSLQEIAKGIISEYESKLSEMAVYFLEEPQFRLAGAEEAIRQLSDCFKRALDRLDPELQQLERELPELLGKLLPLIGSLQSASRLLSFGRNKAAISQEVIELMRTYAKQRYRQNVLLAARSIYRSLLGHAPEYLREVNFCRLRLTDLAKTLQERMSRQSHDGSRAGVQWILPSGCRTVEDAAERFLNELPESAVQELDAMAQVQIRRQFRALIHLCMDVNDQSEALQAILEKQASQYLEMRLEHASPAEMFFRYREADQGTHRDLYQAFEESLPELVGSRANPRAQVCILAVPADESGEQFRLMARELLTEVDLVTATHPDQIVFYREQRHLTPMEIPQLSATAREAVEQLQSDPEAIPPASRFDIAWRPIRD